MIGVSGAWEKDFQELLGNPCVQSSGCDNRGSKLPVKPSQCRLRPVEEAEVLKGSPSRW